MTITITAASLLVFLLVYISMQVSLTRRKTRTSIGDGGNEALQYAVRAQGNLVEYAPMFLILLGLLEMRQTSSYALWALAAVFVAGRTVHIYGLTACKVKANPFRFWGMIGTFLSLFVSAVLGIISLI